MDDDIAVEARELGEESADLVEVLDEQVRCCDEDSGCSPPLLVEVRTEHDDHHELATNFGQEPLGLAEFVVPSVEVEWLVDFLSDSMEHETLNSQDDDRRNVANRVVDAFGDSVLCFAELTVLSDEDPVEAHGDEHANYHHGGDDVSGRRAEVDEHTVAHHEFDHRIDDLEGVSREAVERLGTLFDLVDGIARVMADMPRHRQGQNPLEEMLPVVTFHEERARSLDDSSRSMQRPEYEREPETDCQEDFERL